MDGLPGYHGLQHRASVQWYVCWFAQQHKYSTAAYIHTYTLASTTALAAWQLPAWYER